MNLARAQTRDGGQRIYGSYPNRPATHEETGAESIGAGSFEGQVRKSSGNNLKYNDEDGFMRGARIAEKI